MSIAPHSPSDSHSPHSGTHSVIPLPTLRYKHVRSRAPSRLRVHRIARVLPFLLLQRGHPGHSFLPPPPQISLQYSQSRLPTLAPLSIRPSSRLQLAFNCTAKCGTKLKKARSQPGRRDPLQFGLRTHDDIEAAARPPQNLQELILDWSLQEPNHAIGTLDGWRRRRTRYHKVTAFKGAHVNQLLEPTPKTPTHDTEIRDSGLQRVSRLLDMQGPPGTRFPSIDDDGGQRPRHHIPAATPSAFASDHSPLALPSILPS
ncbi:hypothetical protein DFP72DRAFT_1061190 [Ephemerocybe angulata]|uniref:Uncharacterized protein n=1 Tax=Ephemerocybe angulata TaxID=980116 RepID=A0A8H6IAF4_9AGAR|nr:hypothetical protein DFP72DRAFT_1061190 [Tulosesus angulatus]